MLSVASLHIHPVKSLGGFSVQDAITTDRGFEHDRRWMLVDENGRFISQRECAAMACLHTAPLAGGFRVTDVRDGATLELPWSISTGDPLTATVWSDTVDLIAAQDHLSIWFSSRSGLPCTLAYMPDATTRTVDRTFAEGITSLSDGFPYLIVSQASLDDLNARIRSSSDALTDRSFDLPMDRFRPNIVVAGGEPFQEDTWTQVRIGEHAFSLVKPCARCPIPTIDQRTGERGKEPLRTLATYRSMNNKVLFGMNAISSPGYRVHVGMPVIPLS